MRVSLAESRTVSEWTVLLSKWLQGTTVPGKNLSVMAVLFGPAMWH